MSRLALPDAEATEALGRRLARALVAADSGATVALEGELGAGKTTLARAVLRALGHAGPVTSPTYTLMEPYEIGDRRLLHLDLYRLGDPEELEFLGLRELAGEQDWLLVEWPDRGAGHLPPIDLVLQLAHAGQGRWLSLAAATERGRWLAEAAVGGDE